MTDWIEAFVQKYERAVLKATENDDALGQREDGKEGHSSSVAEAMQDERDRQGDEWSTLLAEAVKLLQAVDVP